MLRPEFWNDEKLGMEPESVQLTFAGTWTFSDDYGVIRANPVWLKSQIFPYKQNLRIDVFSKWLEALEGHEMLIPFTLRGERYYFIRTFRLHQSVEKPSKTRNCTEEELRKALESLGYREQSDRSWEKVAEDSGSSRVVVGDEEKLSKEKLSKVDRANALVVPKDDAKARQQELKKEYATLLTSLAGKDLKEIWAGLSSFIRDQKPDWPEPYVDTWNIFASRYKLSQVEAINEDRRKKFNTRLQENLFDFLRILEKIKGSTHLKGENNGSWKVSIDWILQNDKNYLKILEGNYD